MDKPDEVQAVKEAIRLIKEMKLISPNCLRAIAFEELFNCIDNDEKIEKGGFVKIPGVVGLASHGTADFGIHKYRYVRSTCHSVRDAAFYTQNNERYFIANVEYTKEAFEKIKDIIGYK